MDLLPIKRALLSVTDKSGLVEFATFLHGRGVELVSTGGTARMLSEAGLKVTPVSKVTGFPEILGGRVKTLHPHIHGGILADKDNPEHLATLKELGIVAFDLIVVNLYNFAEAARKGLDLKAAVEEIDIGGPCMLRATAKNFHSMLVLPDPADYAEATAELDASDMRVGLDFRRRMAAKTFARTAAYDGMITEYLSAHNV
ncbi:IMP cyclohydrolase [Desulfovibrio psychrotolerans]|uniref:IMP cyclohydrolase n=1 Tax=Desulfovibrio psychrotolerans TaxID=415242 RepID=A0A7J0BYC4_9BACT|nr:IMP cyclohydrolase [Desulfovibrio psychrotolerans]GFM38161.1 IMP cyclohydrolase [Desulfovibrio psychrotolerans]